MTQLYAFSWTLIIEVPIAAFLLRGLPILKVIIVSITASLMTHPIAWHFSTLLAPDEYVSGVYLIEVLVTLLEAIWYRLWLKIGWKRAFIVSIVANGASFLAGWWGIV